VQVTVRARESTANSTIALLQLLDTSAARVGDDKASSPQALTTSYADYTFGGSSDLWGNSLTRAWVQDADFGIGLGVTGDASSTTAVDSVGIEVFYTPPSVYYVIGPSSGWTDPDATEIKAGQLDGGGAATASGNETAPTSTDEPFTFASAATGLTAGVSYKTATVWSDGTNNSNVSVSSAWSTTGGADGAITLTGASATSAATAVTAAGGASTALTGATTTASATAPTATGAATTALTGATSTSAAGVLAGTGGAQIILTGATVTAAATAPDAAGTAADAPTLSFASVINITATSASPRVYVTLP
jgi:hypothetical protein